MKLDMAEGDSGGRRRRRRSRSRPVAEINVTPFVDVMLVFAHRLHGRGAFADGGGRC